MHISIGLMVLVAMLVCLCACSSARLPRGDADSLDQRRPMAITWIMIWNGSTEKHWWKPTDYHGCRVLVDGTWQSIDWNNDAHLDAYCRAIRDAGIDAIVVDLTNGFRWQRQATGVQQFCHDNAMLFAVAFNPHGGSAMEAGCKRIWDDYASPDNPLADCYLQQDGKPLAVLYTTRKGYADSTAQAGEYRNRFATVWASGEDSDRDKWGWQLEPHVGPVPSDEAMFVTGSVKFASPRTTPDEWRKHLAWLDYGFLVAQQANARYLIVGSFDDVHERNAWMVVDTTDAPPGWQMRDKTGAISNDAYYQRVCEWLNGRPTTVAGGLIRDGAYFMQSAAGRALTVEDNRLAGSAATLGASVPGAGEPLDDLIWFYHLGNNVYRLIKLNAGLPLEAADANVVINSDSDAATQCWQLEKTPRGHRLRNIASRQVLACSGNRIITAAPDDASPNQYWSLIPHAVIPASP